jgi:hypothetical protein
LSRSEQKSGQNVVFCEKYELDWLKKIELVFGDFGNMTSIKLNDKFEYLTNFRRNYMMSKRRLHEKANISLGPALCEKISLGK